MSSFAISALERGHRRRPQLKTLDLLVDALSLDADQRAQFAAVARSPRSGAVMVGPWTGAADTEPAPSNLPRQTTPLIGRENDLVKVAALVRAHQLTTLVGAGGIGKTRLALRVGESLLEDFDDGVWLVELAPLSEPGSIVQAIASTFGLVERNAGSLLTAVLRYLQTRRPLLIVDNCEHIVEEASRVVDAIVHHASNVRILVTSREPLRVAAEHVYRVPPLAVPANRALDASEAQQYGATALFAERAEAAHADFTLTDGVAPVMAEICARLDGIPLAIELAAARVPTLALRDLLYKLDDRFRVLTEGSRLAVPRHQTMQALIDWSYDLLTPQEQQFFCKLAIFAGGWSLEAAEVICSDETLDARDVVSLNSSLVDKSLVVADLYEHSRYRFLESTRAFSLEKLEQSGERDALERRRAQWLSDLGERAYEAGWTPTAHFRAKLAPESENAKAAIEWALAHGEVELATNTIVGFSRSQQALAGEWKVRTWLETVLDRIDADVRPALAARAWRALSTVVFGSNMLEAARRALELDDRCNDPDSTIRSLTQVAFGLTDLGSEQEAQSVVDRAIRLSNAEGLAASAVHCGVLLAAGGVAFSCGRLDEAQQRNNEALELATTLGSEVVAVAARLNLADLEFQMGNAARALELLVATETLPTPSMPFAESHALIQSAEYRIALGDLAGARIVASDGLRLARGAFEWNAVRAMQHLATLAVLTSDPRRGALVRGYVDAWYGKAGIKRERSELAAYETFMRTLREKLGDTEIEALTAEGARLSEDQAVAAALATT